jgi:hypothetical protein
MKDRFLEYIWRKRFQSSDKIKKLLEQRSHFLPMPGRRPPPLHSQQQQQQQQPHRSRFIKGVVNGNFVRIKVPDEHAVTQGAGTLPRLYAHQIVPRPFKHVEAPPKTSLSSLSSTSTSSSSSSTTSSSSSSFASSSSLPLAESFAQNARDRYDRYRRLLWEWWKANWPILILNFGSMCTLIGFTRTDILELRALSVAGSCCFIAYTVLSPPVRTVTVVWPTIFATINSYNIYKIMEERTSSVRLTAEQEEIYVHYFMPVRS